MSACGILRYCEDRLPKSFPDLHCVIFCEAAHSEAGGRVIGWLSIWRGRAGGQARVFW